MKWKDITTYSQGDKERIPCWWKANLETIDLRVGNKHIYVEEDKWIMHCEKFGFDIHILESDNEEDAKKEAVELVKAKIREIYAELDEAK